MPKRKQPPQSTEQYRKPFRAARIREGLAVQLDILAELRATDFTEEVNRAVREMLEREGRWPPSSQHPSK